MKNLNETQQMEQVREHANALANVMMELHSQGDIENTCSIMAHMMPYVEQGIADELCQQLDTGYVASLGIYPLLIEGLSKCDTPWAVSMIKTLALQTNYPSKPQVKSGIDGLLSMSRGPFPEIAQVLKFIFANKLYDLKYRADEMMEFFSTEEAVEMLNGRLGTDKQAVCSLAWGDNDLWDGIIVPMMEDGVLSPDIVEMLTLSGGGLPCDNASEYMLSITDSIEQGWSELTYIEAMAVGRMAMYSDDAINVMRSDPSSSAFQLAIAIGNDLGPVPKITELRMMCAELVMMDDHELTADVAALIAQMGMGYHPHLEEKLIEKIEDCNSDDVGMYVNLMSQCGYTDGLMSVLTSIPGSHLGYYFEKLKQAYENKAE